MAHACRAFPEGTKDVSQTPHCVNNIRHLLCHPRASYRYAPHTQHRTLGPPSPRFTRAPPPPHTHSVDSLIRPPAPPRPLSSVRDQIELLPTASAPFHAP